MVPLTIKDLYNKTSLEAWNLLRLQLLNKMRFIANGGATEVNPGGGWWSPSFPLTEYMYPTSPGSDIWAFAPYTGGDPMEYFEPRDEGGFWGIYGMNYDYNPWGAAVYEALAHNWTDWYGAKFFDKQSFSNEYKYRKWLYDFIYTSAASTGNVSLPELIVKGICACMCCYSISPTKHFPNFPTMMSTSIYDLTYHNNNPQTNWIDFCTDYSVAEGTKDLISYGSYKLLGAHIHSAQLIIDLSAIICKFTHLILYSPKQEYFITWYLGDYS